MNVGERSHLCGGGRQYQRRTCTNPVPAHGGNNCTGNTSRTISCNNQACPAGIQTKEFVLLSFTKILEIAIKSFSFPLLYFILFIPCWKQLFHLDHISAASFPRKCQWWIYYCWFVVDGKFTSSVNIGKCSHSCGEGRQYQRRTCTNPVPAHGGNNCTGNTSRTISCNNQACPGIRTKEFVLLSSTKILQFAARSYSFPFLHFILFRHLLKNCVNVFKYMQHVCWKNVYQTCFSWFVVDGKFISWVNVGECSHLCGGGRQYQRRTCTNPVPAHGGNYCDGSTSRTISCNNQACKGIQTKRSFIF